LSSAQENVRLAVILIIAALIYYEIITSGTATTDIRSLAVLSKSCIDLP
jgi:hypothetical protein